MIKCYRHFSSNCACVRRERHTVLSLTWYASAVGRLKIGNAPSEKSSRSIMHASISKYIALSSEGHCIRDGINSSKFAQNFRKLEVLAAEGSLYYSIIWKSSRSLLSLAVKEIARPRRKWAWCYSKSSARPSKWLLESMVRRCICRDDFRLTWCEKMPLLIKCIPINRQHLINGSEA